MNNNNEIRKDNDSRKILSMIIMIAVLMVTTTGATYAYFAISATSNNTITGTAATGSLMWGANDTAGIPTLSKPTNTANATYSTKPLVPQKSLNGSTNILQKAVTGVTPTGESSVVQCVDANGNAVCRIYQFTICNNSSATTKVNGTITFSYPSGSNFNNLKWQLMTSTTATGTVSTSTIKSATTSAQSFATDVSLTADTDGNTSTCSGGSQTYYLVVWIEEMGYDQGVNQSDTTKRDIGTFYASIAFNSSNGTGITSTITA